MNGVVKMNNSKSIIQAGLELGLEIGERYFRVVDEIGYSVTYATSSGVEAPYFYTEDEIWRVIARYRDEKQLATLDRAWALSVAEKTCGPKDPLSLPTDISVARAVLDLFPVTIRQPFPISWNIELVAYWDGGELKEKGYYLCGDDYFWAPYAIHVNGNVIAPIYNADDLVELSKLHQAYSIHNPINKILDEIQARGSFVLNEVSLFARDYAEAVKPLFDDWSTSTCDASCEYSDYWGGTKDGNYIGLSATDIANRLPQLLAAERAVALNEISRKMESGRPRTRC